MRSLLRRPAFLELVSLVVAASYTAAVIVFVERHCYFYGDDFSGFLMSRTEKFWRGVMYPVGGQVVPMARILDSAFFHVAGLSYGAAVATLTALHVLGMVYLYRTLNLLKPSPVNAVLVALYACYLHTWVQLGWWIAGLERVPFVAFASIALYHYVRFQKTRAKNDLVLTCLCDLLALGFYSKALLLPLCMLALDVARFPVRELRTRLRDFAAPWLTAFGLLVAGGLFSALEHHAAGTLGSALGKSSAGKVLEFAKLGMTSFAHSLFATPMSGDSHRPRVVVVALWFLLLGYTTYRARRSAVAWAVLFLLALMNFVMIGVSNRVAAFGLMMAFEVRYYWELCFFSFLLVGVVLQMLPTDTREARFFGRAPRASRVLTAALLLLYAITSYRGFSRTALTDSAPMPMTRAFMENLAADLKHFSSKQDPVKLADTNVPGYVVGLDFTFQRDSQLLFLMDERVRYTLPGKEDYRIGEDGHLIPTHRPRPH